MTAISLILVASLCLVSFQGAQSSKCVVSPWREWSDCLGNCDFAQRVRNRDVLRPPFPEKNEVTGDVVVLECPPLYEVQYCTPSSCEENPFGDEKQTVKKARVQPRPKTDYLNRLPLAAPSSNSREFFRSTVPKATANPKVKASGVSLFSGSRGDCGLDEKCCRIRRILCPDGSRPRKVSRWYRQKDEPFCRLYDYPYCSDDLDVKEGAFLYETNCQEICFTDEERSVLPSLRLI